MTVYGRTRCPWCEQRFTADARPTTTIEVNEPTPARPGYAAGRAGGTVRVHKRWHVECLAMFRKQNEEHRAKVERERLETIERIKRSAGGGAA